LTIVNVKHTHNLEQAARRGLTLTELLVVIAIVLVLTIAALPSVLGLVRDRKFSDAARTLQAALAGARDRAISSGQVTGIRLSRGDTDPWESTTLVYVSIPEPYTVGGVTVSGTTVTPAVLNGAQPVFDQVDPGKDGTTGTLDDVPLVVPYTAGMAPPEYSQIRFNSSGRLYTVTNVNTTVTPATLTISPTPPPGLSTTGPHAFQLLRPPVPRSQDDPIQLAEGSVIDLRTNAMAPKSGSPTSRPTAVELLYLPRSLNIPNQIAPAGADRELGTPDDLTTLPELWPKLDVLFGPTGAVVGPAAQNSVIYFWIGERGDQGGIGPDDEGGTDDDTPPNRPRRMVTLNTRTGAVLVTDDPEPVEKDTTTVSEVYEPVLQAIGLSAPLVDEWVRY